MVDHNQPAILYPAKEVGQALRLPVNVDEPVPQEEESKLLFYLGRWNITDLRISGIGRHIMIQSEYSHLHERPGHVTPAGYHRLFLSHGNDTRDKSLADLNGVIKAIEPTYELAPFILVVSMLLVHIAAGGECGFHRIMCAPVYLGRPTVSIAISKSRKIIISEGEDGCQNTVLFGSLKC